ncbi:hypothetical protein CEUSTIGMA_g8743.t1 [Chlamydomonas eustigma]|uniref:Uncharacterized protein n=1 Tax=Chlamydomonas eustigma TaxID=1157962 RepID=A0A250XEH2_9CHLO|nr:hypothetical protein CEUSTIGMA_g8743.t1 [Chlamydomonas eustigma]|eukprot:GAX81312.1 hypothetical protein CEUSTIGMA_g8743.t1 [Chlamydomonas eustigma]
MLNMSFCRWLHRYFNAFEAKPEAMESITLDDSSSPLLVSSKYREAIGRSGRKWVCARRLGGRQGWPADMAVMQYLQGHSTAVRCVAFSFDGRQVATCSEETRVWDLASGQSTLTLKGHSDAIKCVTFSPDGRQLATASEDMTARIWDLASGQSTVTLKAHASAVSSLSFSPDCCHVVSGSNDRTAILWDALSGAPTLILEGHINHITNVAYSPDGHLIVTGSNDRTARI